MFQRTRIASHFAAAAIAAAFAQSGTVVKSFGADVAELTVTAYRHVADKAEDLGLAYGVKIAQYRGRVWAKRAQKANERAEAQYRAYCEQQLNIVRCTSKSNACGAAALAKAAQRKA